MRVGDANKKFKSFIVETPTSTLRDFFMKELKNEFKGKGEVSGYAFKQLKKSPYSYLYEVKNEENGSIHYEVFKRKENTQFDCVSYPRSKSFGLWAWTIVILDKAIEKFDDLNLVIDLD